MTDNVNQDIEVTAEADPKRPYKMYAAMISAFLSSFIASGVEQPIWAVALETAAIAALAVYLVGNPINIKKSRLIRRTNEPTLFD